MTSSRSRQPEVGPDLAFLLRKFYGCLWNQLEALYPGYHTSSGGPVPRGRRVGLSRARDLYEEVLHWPDAQPKMVDEVRKDYEATLAMVDEFKGIKKMRQPDWLREHEAERVRLLERVEYYSRLI